MGQVKISPPYKDEDLVAISEAGQGSVARLRMVVSRLLLESYGPRTTAQLLDVANGVAQHTVSPSWVHTYFPSVIRVCEILVDGK